MKGFDYLSDVEKTSFVLGCEFWEKNFEPLLAVILGKKNNLWEAKKVKLCPTQRQSQSSAGGLTDATVVEGQREGRKW